MLKMLMTSGRHDFEMKACKDCKHMQAAIGWWCVNKKAINYRGTSFPGVNNCTFWEPCKHIRDVKSLLRNYLNFNNYIKIEGVKDDER